MPVDTTKVQGRRTLKFNSLDDIIADVEKLNQGNRRTIGNWSEGQILTHVTIIMDWCIDGAPVKAPWIARVMGFFIKGWFLRRPMPAGFKLPEDAAKHLVPPETSWDDALARFRKVMERMKAIAERKPSPFLGKLSREQWDQLHCRHCELHLSFILLEPADA